MTCVASVCPKLIERRILATHPKIGAYVCSFYKDGDWVEVRLRLNPFTLTMTPSPNHLRSWSTTGC